MSWQRAEGVGLPLWCSFTTVRGVTAFDLETFLAVVQRSRKWQCPTSMRNATVHELQIDTFTQRILEQLKVPPVHTRAPTPRSMFIVPERQGEALCTSSCTHRQRYVIIIVRISLCVIRFAIPSVIQAFRVLIACQVQLALSPKSWFVC